MPISSVSNADQVTIQGPLVVQNDPLGAVASLSFDNGNFISDGSGNITVLNLNAKSVQGGVANGGATSLAQTLASSGTISNGQNRVYRVSAGTNATVSALVLTNGSTDGQDLTIVNVGATGMTIATHVTPATTIAASAAAGFVWDAGTTLWFHKA